MRPTGDYISVCNGGFFSFTNPQESVYDIDTVVHALSQICRFGGHTSRFYSVLQHCILVAKLLAPKHKKWGLLHDAHEFAVYDLPTPLKSILPDFRALDRRVENAVRERFGLLGDMPEEVKIADLRALATERRDLMPQVVESWTCLEGIEPDPDPIMEMTQAEVVEEFFAVLGAVTGGETIEAALDPTGKTTHPLWSKRWRRPEICLP